MNNFFYILFPFLLLATLNSCRAQTNNLAEFIPKGFVIQQKILGDLNKDGSSDYVLLIKATNKNNIVTNRFEEKVDRNRRGIIILLNKNGKYEKTLQNLSCFSSENEDGGVYTPPELYIEIKKGSLYIHYAHGRYGYWKYTFRYQNSDFELIGYDDSDNFGPLINSETSINFSTKKMLVRKNINTDADGGDEIFEDKWNKLSQEYPILLSEILDFDNLDIFKMFSISNLK